MRGYTAVLSARFRTLLQYRAAALAGFGTQFFWGLLRMMIFTAFYGLSTRVYPLSRDDTITYIWLGQAMLQLLPWSMDADVRTMVRTGTVAYELLRPLDLYTLWYMRAIAARTAPTLLRCLPMFVVAGLFFGLRPPPTLASGFAWILTTAGALFLGCAISTLMSVTIAWTVSGEGVARLIPPLVYTFSGLLVPLPLLPQWMQPVLNFLPFRGLMDTPFRMYLGHIPPAQLPFVLGHQLAWTLVLIALGRWILAQSVRHLVIQGG
jgi:ABC-2 type transport system permease protein